MGNPNEDFNDLINKIFTFLLCVKYIAGTLFLIFGILMFLTKNKHWKGNNTYFQENKKNLKQLTKFVSAITCIIITLGFYLSFYYS